MEVLASVIVSRSSLFSVRSASSGDCGATLGSVEAAEVTSVAWLITSFSSSFSARSASSDDSCGAPESAEDEVRTPAPRWCKRKGRPARKHKRGKGWAWPCPVRKDKMREGKADNVPVRLQSWN